MARYPLVQCPACDDTVAAVPTRTIGMLSVHDHKRTPRALVLCPSSMAHVPAAAVAVQEELPEDATTAAAVETLPLF